MPKYAKGGCYTYCRYCLYSQLQKARCVLEDHFMSIHDYKRTTGTVSSRKLKGPEEIRKTCDLFVVLRGFSNIMIAKNCIFLDILLGFDFFCNQK